MAETDLCDALLARREPYATQTQVKAATDTNCDLEDST